MHGRLDWAIFEASPFIYKNGELQILGPLPEMAFTVRTDIVGDDFVGGHSRVTLKLPDGAIQAKADRVSKHGHIAGVAWFPQNDMRPVLWIDGISLLADELARLPSDSDFTEKFILNRNGELAATASIDGGVGSQPVRVSPLPVSPVDVNFDCSVDVTDLLSVLSHWGSGDPVADIDDSGLVDTDDLLALRAA